MDMISETEKQTTRPLYLTVACVLVLCPAATARVYLSSLPPFRAFVLTHQLR
jgi:hypothetical protein